ncbi:MAG: TRAP transporter large permease subunit [Bosea sp. (in: a-proteobacteria)]|uniref:TRAP transporter large permease n=1 Tax=Bosea sp. (in: a-proteobacteria) TaxID=1871050 RepID=UPI002734D917|nr:TRAP transporter large permease subunit [Bosea sp. (in: a-proteobacteria)]MDP3258567.1 TRAP transporter large permease subunit [Bosea sp. (in: a-proteobacteria)]MDP3318237.1 TRAP transporter large permease subunit [Bosea sp. (in: a-proteobacteria)]
MAEHTQTMTPAATGASARFLLGFDRAFEALCVALMLGSASVAVLQVFCRYVLDAALPWPEEVSIWLFTWAVFLGMALAVGRHAHIAIDLVSRYLPAPLQRLHAGFVAAMIAATSIMMIVHGIDFAGRAIQVSPAMQWPLSYLFIAIAVGGALNLVYLIRPAGGLPQLSGLLSVVAGGAVYLAVRHGAALVWQEAGSPTALMLVAGLLVLFEVPIAFALAFGAFAAFAPLGDIMLVIVPQNMASSLNSFTLLAIPFFIMAAAVMNVGGITTRLVALATSLVGHFRGGLGQANVVTNTLLAGVSGSSTADASAIAKLMVPEMEKHGYHRAFSCALTSASSTLANLIPPSLGLIIYAALASVSVGALFVATIIPGLMAAASLIVVVYIVSRVKGYGGDIAPASWRARGRALGTAIPALLLPLLIVGGVRFGVFTATEAGAIALVYAILCGLFFYRCLSGHGFYEAVRESTFDTVSIVVIIAAASPFAWVLAAEQVPQKIAAAMSAYIDSPVILLLLINLLLLVVGLFMEMIAAMVILVPILVPLVVAAGVDPVQFGIVLVMNLVIGALTPPLGVLVFTTARVGRANVVDVFRAILPFILALVTVLMLVTYVPSLTLAPLRWLGP